MLETSVLAEYRAQWEQPSVVLASYHAHEGLTLESRSAVHRRHANNDTREHNGTQQYNNCASWREHNFDGHIEAATAGSSAKVEDRLLEYQRAYEARRMSLRHEKETQHDDGFTGSPGLNHRSRRLAAKRNAGGEASVHVRLSTPHQRSAEEATLQEGERPRTRAGGATDGTPRINKRSSMMAPRGVQSQFEWIRQKALKQDRQREEQERRLQAECSARPEIDETSRKILRRVNTFVDPIQLVLPVEDRLLRHQERVERELEAKREAQYGANSSATRGEDRSRPVIASHHGVTDASTRLYQDAEERQRAAEERARQEELLNFIDEKGELLYQPRVAPGTSASNAAASRRGGATDVFAYLAQEKLSRDVPPHSGGNDEKHLGHPQIGAYSVLLANLTRPTDKSTFERLAAPTTTTAPASEQQHGHRDFAPAIDKRSQDIDRQRRGDVHDRVALLFQKQAVYDAHRERLRREKEAAEDAEAERIEDVRRQKYCRNNAPKGTSSVGHHTPDATYQRMRAWSDRNENRLKAMRESAKMEEVAECTFEPRLAKTPVRTATPRQRKSTPVRSTPTMRHR